MRGPIRLTLDHMRIAAKVRKEKSNLFTSEGCVHTYFPCLTPSSYIAHLNRSETKTRYPSMSRWNNESVSRKSNHVVQLVTCAKRTFSDFTNIHLNRLNALEASKFESCGPIHKYVKEAEECLEKARADARRGQTSSLYHLNKYLDRK